MDRSRFKTKTDNDVAPVAAARPRPVAQPGEISPPAVQPHKPAASSHAATARPVHHVARPAAPVYRSHPVTSKPASTGEITAPRPVRPPAARHTAHVSQAASAIPAPSSVDSRSDLIQRVDPAIEEDIPDLENLDSTIPSTLPPKGGKKLSKRRIAEIALVVVILAGGFIIFKPGVKQDLGKSNVAAAGLHINTGGAATNSTASVAGTVTFTPVVPVGKPQLANLGSKAYNSEYKSYTFDDTFMGQKIRISQQELPSGQDNAAGLIEKIGASLKAQSVTPITIQSGQPTYLLNNTSKAGSQVVVFTAKGKLLFVQATTAFDASIWPDYLNTFQ